MGAGCFSQGWANDSPLQRAYARETLECLVWHGARCRDIVTVLKVGLKTVDVDANHPFAGRPLRFELEVIDVRDADADEKAHGHVHGPGGHAH